MTLQAFNSRRMQGLYRNLQAFGIGGPPPDSFPSLICVSDDLVYIVDIYKIKVYDTSGNFQDDVTMPGTGILDKHAIGLSVEGSNLFVTQQNAGNKIYVYDLNLSLTDTWNGILIIGNQSYYGGEVYILSGNTVTVYDPTDGSVNRSWSIFFALGGTVITSSVLCVNNDHVFIKTNNRSSYGKPTVSMFKYNIDGTYVGRFDYWERPGFPDYPNKIGRLGLFVNGSYCHSSDFGSGYGDIYRNSTSSATQTHDFNISKDISWFCTYNNELYITHPNDALVSVYNETTGSLIREWSTV